MKENNLEKKIKEEEKKIKLVEEEVRRVVSLKAQEIAEREARKVEELQREKMLDEARKREAVVEELSLGLTNEAVLAREDQEIHHLPL